MTMKNTDTDVQLPDVPENLPRISLIIPFESKMNKKAELDYKLTTAADNIEKELMESYPEEKVTPVVKKLRRIIKDFNYQGHDKSIAIFVSPLIEKVYYFTGTV